MNHLFFILIRRVHPTTTFWSLAAARCTSIAVLRAVVRRRRKHLLPMTGAPLVVLAVSWMPSAMSCSCSWPFL